MASRTSVHLRQVLDSRNILLIVLVAVFLLQGVATIGAVIFLDLPISTEGDSVEYIRTADNVLAGHGFSIERTPPFRPNAFRTPGPLVLNVPLRLLSRKNDIIAAIITRLVVLFAAVVCVVIAAQVGISNHALLAGSLFILSPTIFYYSMLAYSTELPYALACSLLALGTILYVGNGNGIGSLLVAVSALYALYLRPAALFLLIAYVGSCIFGVVVTKQPLRRRLLIAALGCLLGTCVAYGTWSYRNYRIFGAFEYSTVSGENLLKWNAAGMEPFLDSRGKQALTESLNKYPIKLQRYNGADQFVLSNAERKEGLNLIFKYPWAFLESHLRGSVESTVIFRPAALSSRGNVVIMTMSAIHCGYLVLGTVGLLLLWRVLNASRRAALAVVVFIGLVSALTGGALYSPRFRIPLDIALVVGIANLIAWVESRRPQVTRPFSHGTKDGLGRLRNRSDFNMILAVLIFFYSAPSFANSLRAIALKYRRPYQSKAYIA